jgi:hypothetical protein
VAKHDIIHVDVVVLRDADGNYGLGAEFKRINFANHEVVKVASWFYKSTEFDSVTACIKSSLPELMWQADAQAVKFRSSMPQFIRADQLYRPLAILASQDGIHVSVKRKKLRNENIDMLALDALSRKDSVNADI